MAGGKYAAYQRLRPTQYSVSDQMKEFDQAAMRHRREELVNQQIADRKYREETDRKLKVDEKMISPTTGYDSIDEGLADYIYTDLRNQLNEQYEILKRDPKNYKAELEIQRISQEPARIAQMVKHLSDRGAVLEAGIKDGSLSKELNANTKTDFNTLGKDLKFKLFYKDGKTHLNIGADRNDGKNDVLESTITLESLLSGKHMGEFAVGFDDEAWIKNKIDLGVAVHDETKQKGLTTTQTKEVSEKYKAGLLADVNKLFGSDPENLSPQAKAYIAKYQLETPKTEAELTAIKQRLMTPVITSEDTLYSLTKEQARTTNTKPGDFTGNPFSEPVVPSEATWGKGNMANIDGTKVRSIGFNKAIKVASLNIGGGEYLTNAVPENYTFDKSGNMLLDVSYQASKTATYTKAQYDAEMKKAVAESDYHRIDDLKKAETVGDKMKVTIPAQNTKKVVKISPEDQADIAGQLGTTIEAMRSQATIPQTTGELD